MQKQLYMPQFLTRPVDSKEFPQSCVAPRVAQRGIEVRYQLSKNVPLCAIDEHCSLLCMGSDLAECGASQAVAKCLVALCIEPLSNIKPLWEASLDLLRCRHACQMVLTPCAVLERMLAGNAQP
jgi:hypothetical protein